MSKIKCRIQCQNCGDSSNSIYFGDRNDEDSCLYACVKCGEEREYFANSLLVRELEECRKLCNDLMSRATARESGL